MHGMLNAEVTTELARRFPAAELAIAEAVLRSTPLPLLPDLASAANARVRLAAIRIANGSVDRLRAAIAAASADWRDLLVAAGLDGPDWREVLARDGYRAPR